MLCSWFNTLVPLVVLMLAIHWTFAINCYICDSMVNPKCANLTDRALKPELCTYEKLVNDGTARNSWLMIVAEINYHHDSSVAEIPMVCQKVVGTDEHNQQTTVRRCQLGNVQPCDLSRNKAIRSGGKKIDHCSVCSTDGCNGAPSAYAPALGAVVAVALVVAGTGFMTSGRGRWMMHV